MTLENYCAFYNIDKRLMPVMEKLHEGYWYVFQVEATAESAVLTTGYYSGTGKNSKRIDMTDAITKACVKAGFKFSAYNDAPRGGVTGNRVKILFTC